MKKIAILLFCLVLFSVSISVQANSVEPPSPSDPTSIFSSSNAEVVDQRTSPSMIVNNAAADILLIQTNDPWENETYYVGANWYDGVTSDTKVLDELEYTYHIADWDAISSGEINIFSYPVILIVNDQIQEFYDEYAAHVAEFENYVSSGRTLVFFAAGYGWANGELNADLPGGVVWNLSGIEELAENNIIVNSRHPITTAELSDGVPLLNNDLYSNWCSHGWFSELPNGTDIILRESDIDGGEPTFIEYSIGNGRVIASTLTWEHNWHMHTGGDQYGTFARKALDDVFLYAFSGGITPTDEINITLRVEDAPVGVIVNKVAGDNDGPANQTFVDIVATIRTFEMDLSDNVSVVLTVPSDVLGTPVNTYVRTRSNGDDLQSVSYETVGSGQYQITYDLAFRFVYTKQFVWRFEIPDDPQEIELKAEMKLPNIPLVDPYANANLNIVGYATTIIIANRTKLYEEYDYPEVDQLLQQVYTIAQGPPRNTSPIPVVYYVDRYSNAARDWDQKNVDYSGNEAQANTVAIAIDGLIEDWFDDGAMYPFINPDYLLIIGDDNIVPFYRYNDPTNTEGIILRDCDHDPQRIREHPGWCEDSNENPVIHATDEDYLFTDNPYAAHGGGTDWQEGNLETAVGRIVGDSVEDMVDFLTSGVNESFHRTGGVVMASVDGWELGLEPHTGNEQPDLLNVPSIFTDRGFAVRNDDDPTSEVRTIDVMAPFEGGNVSWITNFRNAANNNDGMDLFFIGGHNNYDAAVMNGTVSFFSPGDTPLNYSRFGTDHPIALITGCHGGLAVPDIDVPGGADNDMVYDLIHEGASAYIGATGYSLGSPNNLHNAIWGEALIQGFFRELLEPTQIRSETIGEAMQRGKIDYVFGNDNNRDRKTLTEFVVYGVPWQYIHYPENVLIQNSDEINHSSDQVQTLDITQSSNNTFTLDFTINVSDYSIISDEGYDLINFDDGELNYKDGYPLLPFVKGYTLPLPDDIKITDVSVVNSIPTTIGNYNIPIVVVNPFSEGGITYTDESNINEFYPADLVFSDEDTDGLTFYVFPFQHNPTTDETIFHSQIDVQVTYETSIFVAATGMKVDKPRYNPGDPIQSEVTVANVSADETQLTATLKIIDPMGAIVASQTDIPVVISSGGSSSQMAGFTGNLSEGAYKAFWEFEDDTGVIEGISEYFNVLGGEIMDFSIQGKVTKFANFNLTFSNFKSIPVDVQEEIYIYDSLGVQIAKLPLKTINVDMNSNETTSFSWDLSEYPRDTYTAVAFARVGDIEYGPVILPFDAVVKLVYLPLAQRNYSPPLIGFNSQFNGSAAGWVSHSGTWSLTSDYYGTVGLLEAFASASYDQNYSNFDYRVRLMRDGCEECANSIVVRGTPTPFGDGNRWNSGYSFNITRNGFYSVVKYADGTGSFLQGWTYSNEINTASNWNTLRAVANGSNLYFYINGTLVWSGTDSTLTSGRVGISMYRTTDSTGDQLWADWAMLDILNAANVQDFDPGVVSVEQELLNTEANQSRTGDDRRGP